MPIGIMQPYFFPYIGYFQLIQSVDKFMLYENVTFRVKSWMTRNYILPPKSNPLLINIPVSKRSSFKSIKDIKLSIDDKWRQSFSKTIYMAYKKADFFHETFPLIEQIISFKADSLHEFNSNLIIEICKYLSLTTEISSDHLSYIQLEKDLDDMYNNIKRENDDNLPEKKLMRIKRICDTENIHTYHNPINGRSLYFKEEFKSVGLNLNFIETKQFKYNQYNEDFIPNLSIIDVLMHCGREKTSSLLLEYSMV